MSLLNPSRRFSAKRPIDEEKTYPSVVLPNWMEVKKVPEKTNCVSAYTIAEVRSFSYLLFQILNNKSAQSKL